MCEMVAGSMYCNVVTVGNVVEVNGRIGRSVGLVFVNVMIVQPVEVRFECRSALRTAFKEHFNSQRWDMHMQCRL